MSDRTNYMGEPLGDRPVELQKSEYGTGEYREQYFPEVKWEEYRKTFSDESGFDKNFKNSNGEYYTIIVLPQNTELVRYGSNSGSYTTLKGTPYEMLGLPYKKETIDYHEFVVIADSVKVFCRVKRGVVAPIFDSLGGGVQFKHESNMRKLIREHILEEVFLWQS